ncbi:MAG: efflux RND transporter periplasmic adaptor subunit, partial [Thermoguttaceae bacterium]
MTARTNKVSGIARWVGRLAVLGVFAAGVVLIVLKLAGKFDPKVSESPSAAGPATSSPAPGLVATARLKTVPRTESAVGSIRPERETSIGAKLLARVIEINIRAGQAVREGDLLVRLDDADLKPKLQQAKAALTSAEAIYQQAIVDERRYAEMVKVNAVSKQEAENAATKVRTAEAEVKRAQEAVLEAEATLEWATVRAPLSGVIVDKRVNVGDMVSPGQLLATLVDRMQLVASVRETLAGQLEPGQAIGVMVEKLGKQCEGT